MTKLLEVPDGHEIVAFVTEERTEAPPPPPPAPINVGYCAERHIGLVAWDEKASEVNTKLLNAALASMHVKGDFRFLDGTTGPVLWPIHFSGKTFYFKGRIQTGQRLGCVLRGTGMGGPLGDGEFGDKGIGGMQTRFVRMDPDPKDFVFLVRCGGISVSGIQFCGRQKPGNVISGKGPKTGVGIGIEGRLHPSMSRFNFHEWSVIDCETGLHFLGGYHDDEGKFTKDANAGSSGHWGHGEMLNCRTCVRIENGQAGWHEFDLLRCYSGSDELDCVIDARRGGKFKFNNLGLTAPKTTLLRVDEFSPNSSRFDIYIDRDGVPGSDSRLTLFDYAGPAPQDWMDWDIRFTGHVGSERQAAGMKDIVRFNGLPKKATDKIWFDVNNLDLAQIPSGYQREWAGPYWRLVPEGRK